MITTEQRRAIHRVLDLLEADGVHYQCTGGFAGILHGSQWPLRDLDLDVAGADMMRVALALGPAVTRPAGSYQDGEFALVLLQAEVAGLEIDIAQTEGQSILTATGWEPLGTDLSRREVVPWDGRLVPAISLSDLIAYKRRLPGRAWDVAELETL